MSEVVRYKGKLQEVGEQNDLALALFIDELGPNYTELDKENIAKSHMYEGGWLDMYYDYDMSEDFILSNGKIYKIIDMNKIECEDGIYEASLNKCNVIDFHVMYYNGGCGLSEAIEDALKNIK